MCVRPMAALLVRCGASAPGAFEDEVAVEVAGPAVGGEARGLAHDACGQRCDKLVDLGVLEMVAIAQRASVILPGEEVIARLEPRVARLKVGVAGADSDRRVG